MTVPLPSAFCVAALAVAVGLAFDAGDAQALIRGRSFNQNATGACQSSLPAFESQIRKRPLAIQNDGTASAFISCSLMGTDRSVAGIIDVGFVAENNASQSVDLTCTLVTGLSKFGTPQFLPKTMTLPANSGGLSPGNIFEWKDDDNGGVPFNNFTVNASCNLPPGTGLSVMFVIFDEDVGA